MIDVPVVPRALPEHDVTPVLAWIAAMTRSRDLTLPCAGAPSNVRRYVDAMQAEIRGYRALGTTVSENIARNAQQLRDVVRNTDEQQHVVEAIAAAVGEVDAGAAHVAQTAESLRTLVAGVASTSRAYDAGAEDVTARLMHVETTIDGVTRFVTNMQSSIGRIEEFLTVLDRIARQTQLLGMNAAIEAAHLAAAGRGFQIVAEQVRALGAEASTSGKRVRSTVKLLRHAVEQSGTSITVAAGAIHAMVLNLSEARDRARGIQSQMPRLQDATDVVAAIAAQQSAQLSVIAQAVEAIARHANGLREAARAAERLDLAAALDELDTTLNRYTIATLSGIVIEAPDLASEPRDVRDALEELRRQVDTDQRDILAQVQRLAVAIARNSYRWNEIGSTLEGLKREVESATNSIDETIVGASRAGDAAQSMQGTLHDVDAGFRSSLAALGVALSGTADVRSAVDGAGLQVDAGSEAAAEAGKLFDVIDTISDNTTLLSLNAAIEAAHAGQAGSGFGVIADEIRLLAQRTYASTREIAEITADVAAAGGSMREAMNATVQSMLDATAQTGTMEQLVGALRIDFDRTLEHTAQTATVVTQQVSALANVREAATLALHRIESDTASAVDERRLELASLGQRAHALAAFRPLGTVAEQLRGLAAEMSVHMDAVFDAAVARGTLDLSACFDTNYVELRGSHVRKLSRLFDVSRVPEIGFTPAKFETRYDRIVEDGFNTLIDAWTGRHPAIVAIFAVDLNGFCFGHVRACRQDWTGDAARDLASNRIKRFFEDPLSLRCARIGLGRAAEALPSRSSYQRFIDAGATLAREADRPWGIYTYARDTGTVYNDLSVAIYACDKRVATVRIIYDADTL